ncbi:MAG: hypothetical protein Q9190_006674 [Brigantiaea leucoxantha]
MPDRRRRKSLSIFRPSLTALTPIDDEPPDSAPATLKKHRPTSTIPDQSPSPSPTGSNLERTSSKSSVDRLIPKARPRSLQKSGRPSSLFGSLRSFSSFQDEQEGLTRTTSTPSSLQSSNSAALDMAASVLIHHGPLPEAGLVFRRRCPYLVLTEHHLIQFKDQSRASEMFPEVTSSQGQSRSSMRHSRMSSNGSFHELQTSTDHYSAVHLPNVVAVYKLDDGEPYFTIEIAHFNENSNHASTMTLHIHDPAESELWLSTIRDAASKARMAASEPISQNLVEYTARALEQESDYQPGHFQMFKVVQRANKSGKRSSSDDLTKLTSKICFLVVGLYQVHIVPLPKSARTASSTSLSDQCGAAHGITTLTSVNVQVFDDSFQLTFRQPCQPPSTLYLAALCANEVALCIRRAAEYLRPEWDKQPFTWVVPECPSDDCFLFASEEEENKCYDRTLTAYCAGYGIDTSNIRYFVNYHCEDAPAFELLPPSNAQRTRYSSIELLAIMRALRYNESFCSVSFRHISLDFLLNLFDRYGRDHAPTTTRSGDLIDLPEEDTPSLLVEEIRAIALKSRRLRRFDFSHCLNRKSSTVGGNLDGGSGICEALFPLCPRQFTNVDWIILNGICLSDADVDYLYAAAIEKSSHFRAIEVGYCGLTDRSIGAILQALAYQGETLESINISGNMARLQPGTLSECFAALSHVRNLSVSNMYRTSGPEPWISSEILLRWRLESLDLSGMALNEQTVTSLAIYLEHPQSDTMRILNLNQCALSGGSLGQLLQAMSCPVPRDLRLYVSGNRLEQGHDALVNAIAQSLTPSKMIMGTLEYKEEKNFRRFVEAWINNGSTRYLDISKVSLPVEASNETFETLKKMLSENQAIETLDLSGEEAHLENANFGPGLNRALAGLKLNERLQILYIEHQKLGLQGANTLASILEENSTLREVHCANNEFNLQAFTVLVNGLEQNRSITYLPFMEDDKAASMRKVDKEIDNFRDTGGYNRSVPSKATMKRTLGAAMSAPRSFSSRMANASAPARQRYSDKDAAAAASSLSQNWDQESLRMQSYLLRNFNIARGPLSDAVNGEESERPLTAWSGATAFQVSSNDITPVGEPNLKLEMEMKHEDGDDGVDLGDEGSDVEEALMMGRKLDLE